jgi:hypothetical protein
MADEGFKRKLTAILSADVVGYSRLMDDNEEATIRTLTDSREAMGNLIQQHRGRVVDTIGDNLLAEFTSAVNAVNCAVEIQGELAERNAELLDRRKMEFRIGVNVGDVIEEEDRIYGDGVNIAARVEGLALPLLLICRNSNRTIENDSKLDTPKRLPTMFPWLEKPLKSSPSSQLKLPARPVDADVGPSSSITNGYPLARISNKSNLTLYGKRWINTLALFCWVTPAVVKQRLSKTWPTNFQTTLTSYQFPST